MHTEEVIRIWNKNATGWTELARQGYDTFRNLLNSPAFFGMLPDIDGLEGLDIGCGEGYNTRLAASRGARMTAVEPARVFLDSAIEEENRNPLGIRYLHGKAQELPVEDQSFDFVMATMSFMDFPDVETALKEVRRVLRPGGFFQFSISHPCFQTIESGWIRNEDGSKDRWWIKDYFRRGTGESCHWCFSALPEEKRDRYEPFNTPLFHRPLSEWLNILLDAGFTLERFCEPQATPELLEQHPNMVSCSIITFSLIIRCRLQ